MKRLSKRFLYFLSIAALGAFLGETTTYGQDATGRVTGVVYDQSGGTIAGAHVKVTNAATHVSREAITDASGFYQVLALPVGYYTVSVEQQGFRTTTTGQSKLEINQTLKVDVKMELGSVAEAVTVESTTGTVETINPTLGSTVSERTVQDMPLNGRNALKSGPAAARCFAGRQPR